MVEGNLVQVYSQQDINFAKGNRGGVLCRINELVMNYVFSSRDDGSLSLPPHASLHLQ